MQKTLDDIRKLIDPQGYLQGMEEVKAQMLDTRARMVVNLDLTEDSTELTADQRKEAVRVQMDNLLDIQWRIEEIDRRMEKAKDEATGGRAARRRKKKTEKKTEKS